MRRYLLIFAVIIVLAGAGTALAVATTGTVSVCASATVPAQTLAANGTSVATLPGASSSQCVTTTYTVPTVTTTQTVTTGGTLTAPTRFFVDGSYINTKVPTSPTFDVNNTAYQSLIRTSSSIWTNGDVGMSGQWSSTVYYASPWTPRITVSLTVPYLGLSTVSFPCSSNWVVSAGDNHMIVVDTNGGYWEFQGLDLTAKTAHSVARGNVLVGNAVPTTQDAVSPLPGPSGLILPTEIAAGVIPHGIRVAVPWASTGVRWPAIWSDGSTSGGPPTGAHLWLPRNADLSSLTTTSQHIVATAMQEYGLWIADSGGSFSMPVESTSDSSVYPFTNLSMPQAIVNQLVVLAP